GGWGAVRCGGGACARISAPRGADGGAVCGGPVRGGGEPDVPHWRRFALARGRGAGGPGTRGPSGEAARVPDRARGDRGGTDRARERGAGGGDCARGPSWGEAAGGLRGGGVRAASRCIGASRPCGQGVARLHGAVCGGGAGAVAADGERQARPGGAASAGGQERAWAFAAERAG